MQAGGAWTDAAADGGMNPADRRRLPTTEDVRRQAGRRAPRFAYEFMDGGAGTDRGIARNWAAFDAIEMMPRYGGPVAPPDTAGTLFGRPYAAPFGIAPMAAPSLVFPGGDQALARAAQAHGVPYVASALAGIDVETAARLAPDVLWFQLSRCAQNDHAIGFDLVARAKAAGVHVLVLTCDAVTRTIRPREVRSGIVVPFRMTRAIVRDALVSPRWLYALARRGRPRFPNFDRYLGGAPTKARVNAFLRRETGGSAFSWEELARYRDAWDGPMVLKGVLHPADAERAAAIGLDGVIVSNHGGRQLEALPASIDALPEVVWRVGSRMEVMLDSGVRTGIDVAKAVALGASAAFTGKAMLWGLGALGDDGPGHVCAILKEEFAAALGQLGCRDPEGLRSLDRRHATLPPPSPGAPDQFARTMPRTPGPSALSQLLQEKTDA